MKFVLLHRNQRDVTEVVRIPYRNRPDDKTAFNDMMGDLIKSAGIPDTPDREVSVVWQWLLEDVGSFSWDSKNDE